MSLDRSLKSKDSLVRHRNVLTRSERLAALQEEQRWNEGDSVLALPKVVHRKAAVTKKGKAATDQESPTPAAAETATAAENKPTDKPGSPKPSSGSKT